MNIFFKSENFKLHKSVKYQFYILSFFLLASLIYSYFFPILSQDGNYIGLGSPLLNIGDRVFYINNDSLNNGYGYYLWNGYVIKASFLYPLILKIISTFTNSFGYDDTSKLWNLILISITCSLALSSLLLIDRIAFRSFGREVAFISNWLFIICPYTLFYSLNGSITMYMVFGISLSTFIISKSSIFSKENQFGVSHLNTFLYLFLSLVFISSLRPTGAIFSIFVTSFLILKLFLIDKKNIYKKNNREYKFLIFLISLILLYSFYQLYLTYNYLLFSLHSFTNEKGQFFGVERSLLRSKLKVQNSNIFMTIKHYFYWIIWKITEFVAGLSDIRDSHAGINKIPSWPFLIRTFTGIFIIFPINLFAFLGLFINWKRIFDSGLIWVIFAIFASLAPSLLGVAFTRYLYMFYPPILIISASCIKRLIEPNTNIKFSK